MVVVHETSRCTMELANKSKTRGIIEMPTIVLDPSLVGGLKVALESCKERRRRTVGTVARRATKRVSVGRRKCYRPAKESRV